MPIPVAVGFDADTVCQEYRSVFGMFNVSNRETLTTFLDSLPDLDALTTFRDAVAVEWMTYVKNYPKRDALCNKIKSGDADASTMTELQSIMFLLPSRAEVDRLNNYVCVMNNLVKLKKRRDEDRDRADALTSHELARPASLAGPKRELTHDERVAALEWLMLYATLASDADEIGWMGKFNQLRAYLSTS